MEDSQIVALYFDRQEQAITASQVKYGPYCTHIAFHILRQAEDSEECVSDTWLHAWNAIPPERPNNLRAYLGRITRNLALNRHRKNAAQKRGGNTVEVALSELRDCVSDGSDLEASLLERELGKAISQFLSRLPREKRVAFVLRYYYLYTVREIAEKLGLRESAVKSMLFRLRKQLKTHLEQEGIFYDA